MTINLPSDQQFKWACRRGMLELDLFLLSFYEKQGQSLSKEQKKIFWSLLKESDPDLFSWLMGNTLPPNKDYLDIIERIRANKRLAN